MSWVKVEKLSYGLMSDDVLTYPKICEFENLIAHFHCNTLVDQSAVGDVSK